MESTSNESSSLLSQCIQVLNEITVIAKLSCSITLSAYAKSNDGLEKESDALMSNGQFRNDLFNHLLQLLHYYNEYDCYEEKYMMLLLHLLFGVNSSNDKGSPQSKKQPKRKKEGPNAAFLTEANMDLHYKYQSTKLIELMLIILNTIKSIEMKLTEDLEEDDALSVLEEIEENFHANVNDFFLKYFSLYSNSIHQLINTIYNRFEYEANEYADYVLFMKILVENQINVRQLIVSKYTRLLELCDRTDLQLLSLTEPVDLSNSTEIIRTNQRLKALDYLGQQRLNNDVIVFDDIRYINKNILAPKCKISEEHFNAVLDSTNEVKLKEQLGDGNETPKELAPKEVIGRQIDKIRRNVKKLNDTYQRDINEIRDIADNIQSKYTTNISQLMRDLTELELKNEKFFK